MDRDDVQAEWGSGESKQGPRLLPVAKSPPVESEKALAAYRVYEEMGPERSLRKMAEQQQKYSRSVALLMRWSVKFHWQERVAEYDRQQAERERRKRQDAIDKMNEEHALIGRTQLLRATQRIKQLLDEDKFGPYAAVQLFKVASELERAARVGSEEQAAFKIAVNTNEQGTTVYVETQWGTSKLDRSEGVG